MVAHVREVLLKSKTLLILALLIFSTLPVISQAAGDSNWTLQKQMKLPANASTLSYSSDGAHLAVGHTDGRVSIWSLASGAAIQVLNAHSKKVNSVQFILQDSKILTIGDDNKARLWSTSDWSDQGTIEGVAFSGGVSPDSRWLAAQDPKQAIWLWDLSTLKPTQQLTEPGKGGTQNMTFTADARYIATAYDSPLVIDVTTGKPLSFVSAKDKKTPVNIRQEGKQVSISLGSFQDDDAPTHRVIPSRSGSLVALGRAWYGQAAFVDVWDTGAMKRLCRLKTKDLGTLTSFSFDNSLLAVEGGEHVTIWKVATGKQVASVKGSGIMQFAPNAMQLSVTNGTDLLVYDLK